MTFSANENQFDETASYLHALNFHGIYLPKEKYFIAQRLYEKIPAISPEIARFLYSIAMIKKPSNILEIGYGTGYSSYAICMGAVDSIKSFVSYESEKKRYIRGVKTIEAFSLPVKLFNKHIVKEADLEVNINNSDHLYDFVFIDGIKREYINYFNLIKKRVISGGIIIFDNILFNGKVIKMETKQYEKYCSGAFRLNRFNILSSLDQCFDFHYISYIDDAIAIGVKK